MAFIWNRTLYISLLTLDYFNAALLNKSISFFQKKITDHKLLNSSASIINK